MLISRSPRCSRCPLRCLLLGALLFLGPLGYMSAARPKQEITSHTARVNGLQIHYFMAGHGPAVVLLHGYAETSRMWRPLIPRLADHFSVIAPDLPGIGDSAIPSTGANIMRAAMQMHALVASLGFKRAEVVGHDIGLMVAYAYAARYRADVSKLVLMDAFLPGVNGWKEIYDDPNLWHFRFHGATPEALVHGREGTYFNYYWNEFAADRNHSLTEADRKSYTAAYSRPGRMAAGWAYFASFPKTASDFARLAETKLTFPVLTIGGDKASGQALAHQVKFIGTDTRSVIIKHSGHWVMEEQPAKTMDALLKFL